MIVRLSIIGSMWNRRSITEKSNKSYQKIQTIASVQFISTCHWEKPLTKQHHDEWYIAFPQQIVLLQVKVLVTALQKARSSKKYSEGLNMLTNNRNYVTFEDNRAHRIENRPTTSIVQFIFKICIQVVHEHPKTPFFKSGFTPTKEKERKPHRHRWTTCTQ